VPTHRRCPRPFEGDAIRLATAGRKSDKITQVEPAAARDLDAVERDAISTAIARRHGNLTIVAKELRISKSTLYLKIDKYALTTTVRQARQHDR
jgi:transcriptional regulator with PAS, ATPase and Fis domain